MNDNFGTRLTILRLSKDMTTAELAEAAGVTEATIKRIERRGIRPTLRTILKLARALNIPSQILSGTAL